MARRWLAIALVLSGVASADPPRTRHLLPDGKPRYTNRLASESSPYLQQHAHNPVDWYPWGDEAFARARASGRPVFLSVGYSTCHWCHVMEEESFEDEQIAAYLNANYVAIKVDREERPDVDAVYMKFVQALTGSGGWPMSVWLTAEREPFFGGTYFPPRAGARGARRGFAEVLREVRERFASDSAGVIAEARTMSNRLRAMAAPEPAGNFPSASLIDHAVRMAEARFDAQFGGVAGAPKFPSSFPVRLLLRFARRTGDPRMARMASETLEHMRRGGIHDHVGGGFHRYATDARWRVPHFEKMLYDNALLALAYLEGGQAAKNDAFIAVTRETLDYLLREMRSPDGTFYSATDADSPGANGKREEGLYFVWTPSEIKSALGDKSRAFSLLYGVSDGGNFEGRNILELASDKIDPVALAKLREVRSHRPPPLRDDKVIVAWNALVISALARAAIVLGEQGYRDAALRAAAVLVQRVKDGRGLPHVLMNGSAKGEGFVDDHVLLAAALVDLFELTSDGVWLDRAIALMAEVERWFADPINGGYFMTRGGGEALLLRDKPDQDGPIPSAPSVAALTWLRLHGLTGNDQYRQRAETTLRASARALSSQPLALDHMLHAVDWAWDSAKEIVIVSDGDGALTASARPLLDVLRRHFVPNAMLVVASESTIAGDLGKRIPWIKGKVRRGNRATAYVCEHGSCKLPTSDPAKFATQLDEVRGYR